jgi:hypothetical protein
MARWPSDEGENMNTVIGKKTAKHLQAGDVIGLLGDHMHYTLDAVDRLTTVVSVEQRDRIAFGGTDVVGKYYLITCSDGNTYRINGKATKYRIYDQQVAS